jgi:hypothetical protein
VTRPTRALAAVALAIAAAAALLACPPQNLPKPIPPSVQVPGYDPQAGARPPADAAPSTPTSPTTPVADPFAPAAAGAACTGPGDCASGICEGQGCGTATGVCAPAQRACTYDIRPYCGCDGVTFSASGSCPGTRYQHRGACTAAGSGAALPAGASCLAGTECASGVCEGKGCGADAPGVCAATSRRCTRDRRAFCGCDGKTFFGSSSCPGGRYAKSGSCPS